jgi:hypothetical protein
VISYSEREIFTLREKKIYHLVCGLVGFVAPSDIDGEPIRCHELARAVGKVLDLEVCDGRFGFVEHSWLWTESLDPAVAPWVLPRILDVYVPGAIPQVQLVDTHSGLPPRYYLSNVLDVTIREDVVEHLVRLFKEAL